MSNSLMLCCVDNFSYQHIQGIMLKNLNLLAPEADLSHAEYRLMGILIGLWNKKYNMAFPNLTYLAKSCKMAKSTILKALNKLVELGFLIVIRTKGKRNKYFFSNRLLANTCSINKKTTGSFTCKTTHDKTELNKKTDKQSLVTVNDDISSISEYKEVTTILKSWLYPDPKNVIKKHGINNLKTIIKLIKEKAPANPGAYLRVILKNSYSDNPKITNSEDIKKYPDLFKEKYWKHIPSGKVFQVLPEVGIHSFFKYHKQSNCVELFEEGFKDHLDNFKGSSFKEYSVQNITKNDSKPSKIDIINEMIANGKNEEAEYLRKFWQKNKEAFC